MNSGYEWVCPSRNGKVCISAEESTDRADLFDSSHWLDAVTLDPESGVRSGVSTKPSKVRAMIGNGAFDLRFSFYETDASTTPSDDGYAKFSELGNMFSDAGVVKAEKGTGYAWTTLKHTRTQATFKGAFICWIPQNLQRLHRGFEAGLFMGSADNVPDERCRKFCHLDNDKNQIQLKSLYAKSVDYYSDQSEWYKNNQRLSLVDNQGTTNFRSEKIAIWVRATGACDSARVA